MWNKNSTENIGLVLSMGLHRNFLSILFWGLIATGLFIRFFYVFLPPVYTTDLLRNIGFGEAFWTWGFQIYSITAFDLSPAPAQFLWSTHHYTYPAVTLVFFGVVTLVSNSIVWGKLVLTLIDCLNSYMFYRVSEDRWLALLYLINPISIWYTSREGQFEAWVIFWVLISFLGLKKNRSWAFGALGIAIQTKLFPVFLVPYFVMKMSWHDKPKLFREILWGVCSLWPSVLAILFGTYLSRYLDPGYMPFYNPLTWNIANPSWFPHFPYWLIVGHFLVSLLFLALCLDIARKRRSWLELLAPLAFVVVVKTSVIGQFWYMMMVPALCLTVEDKFYRRILVCAAIILGLRSIISILIGPIGYQNPMEAQQLIELAFWGY